MAGAREELLLPMVSGPHKLTPSRRIDRSIDLASTAAVILAVPQTLAALGSADLQRILGMLLSSMGVATPTVNPAITWLLLVVGVGFLARRRLARVWKRLWQSIERVGKVMSNVIVWGLMLHKWKHRSSSQGFAQAPRYSHVMRREVPMQKLGAGEVSRALREAGVSVPRMVVGYFLSHPDVLPRSDIWPQLEDAINVPVGSFAQECPTPDKLCRRRLQLFAKKKLVISHALDEAYQRGFAFSWQTNRAMLDRVEKIRWEDVTRERGVMP